MKLGLLFGEDIEASSDDSPEVLSFHHKLLQEYMAAVYITEQIATDDSFLMESFPTWEKIEQHKEVINFACGILSGSDATLITNHVAKIIAQRTQNELDSGLEPALYREYEDTAQSLLSTFKREGCDIGKNPDFCKYSMHHEQSLLEVLKNISLIYFVQEHEGISFNDHEMEQIFKDGQLSSNAQIILHISHLNHEDFQKLRKYFKRNIVALKMNGVASPDVLKLGEFTQLKYLDITPKEKFTLKAHDMVQSINCWGSDSKLRYLCLDKMSIPESCLVAICKCPHLKSLILQSCSFGKGLSFSMISQLPALKMLDLSECHLNENDLAQITQASRENKLPKMEELVLNYCLLQHGALEHVTQAFRQGELQQIEKLKIGDNPFGEQAINSLLEALLVNRCHKELELQLYKVDIPKIAGERSPDVSKDFASNWNKNHSGSKITITGFPQNFHDRIP